MPNKKSAEKALRQGAKLHKKNLAEKQQIKKLIKKTRKAVESGNADKAKEGLKLSGKALDKAVSHGLIRKNKAARLKSRLHKKVVASAK